MTILVTGSSGHLGEAMMRTLRAHNRQARGVDLKPGAFTDATGSISDPGFVEAQAKGCTVIVHTATLHKPHVATHSRQDFVDTNITGTLNLLEAARTNAMHAFIFTSTTSVFGNALVPPPDEPAAWITEDVRPVPKNIYGVTKTAAEDLVELFHRRFALPALILRTSRFFPEEDDNRQRRDAFVDANLKVCEFLYRRVAVEDVVEAHLLAIERAPALGFGRYIISATPPFAPTDLPALRLDAARVIEQRFPQVPELFARLGWRALPSLDRVYVNDRARQELGWQPRDDFATILERVTQTGEWRGKLALTIGAKGYHDQVFEDGPFPVD